MTTMIYVVSIFCNYLEEYKIQELKFDTMDQTAFQNSYHNDKVIPSNLENYLHDIPRDIQEMIMDISKRRYCDIYISFWNNCKNTNCGFVSKRMNRNITKYSKTIKNVVIDSEQYANREREALAILKSHITRLVSNLKKERIRKILYDNDIYDAKITYNKYYAIGDSIIDDYEKALLIEIIYGTYYYKIFIIDKEL
jgi:hypothetical protein